MTTGLATVAHSGVERLLARWEARLGVGVTDLAWSPDGGVLAVATREGQVRLLDGATGRELALLTEHGPGAPSLAWRRCGTILATSGGDGALRCHARASLDLMAELDMRARVDGLAWSPDGGLLAGRVAGLPAVWAAADSHAMRPVRRRVARLVAWHPTERRLLGVEASRVWSLALGGAARTSSLRSAHPILSLAVRRDGAFAAASTTRGVAIWELATGAACAVPGGETSTRVAAPMTFCHGTDWFVASRGGDLGTWDLGAPAACRHRGWFRAHAAEVTGLVTLPAGGGFVSSGADGLLHAWSIGTGVPWASGSCRAPIRVMHGDTRGGVATGSTDHRVAAWDV